MLNYTNGKLTKWNDDRGFGFITPDGGGEDIFAHISAFPRGGGRPSIGEVLSFEIRIGKEGKPQAVNIQRANTRPSAPRSPSSRNRAPASGSSAGKWLGVLLMVLVAGGLMWRFVLNSAGSEVQISENMAPLAEPVAIPTPRVEEESRFRCDGRTHCSQMTSCAEAEFFLRNCPGVEMDGNNDGEPCEQQWCN